MKIIQICASYKPAYVYGGPIMSVSKLSEELTKAEQDLVMLSTTANGKEELDVPIGKETIVDGVRTYYFKRWTKDHTHFSPGLYWFLHRQIQQAKKLGQANQLIIHIHAWWNLISIFSCLIAKIHRVKVIISPRGMLNDYTQNNKNSKSKAIIHSTLGKYLLAYSYIHATSQKEKNDISLSAQTKQIFIVPNFVKTKEINLNHSITSDTQKTFNLIFLSRIEEKKGLDILFKALARLNLNYNLYIAGTGEASYISKLKEFSEDLMINDSIHWLGHVNNDKKFQLLQSKDLMILSSHNENFANVVIESLSVGTPVLISENVGLADYVKSKDLGWISSTDVNELAQTIQAACLDLEKRAYIQQNAPEIIKADFDEHRIIKEYIKMYQDILNKS